MTRPLAGGRPGGDPGGGAPSGAASGDLGGTYPAPEVQTLAGGDVVIITTLDALEREFPVDGGGVYTINRSTDMREPASKAPISLGVGERIVATAPLIGDGAVTVLGSVSGPLITASTTRYLAALNQDPTGEDWLITGGVVLVDTITALGANAGTFKDLIQGGRVESAVHNPQIPGGRGWQYDGSLGNTVFSQCFCKSAGVAPYTANDVLPSCSITTQVFWVHCSMSAALGAADSMFLIDPAASLPTTALPTSTVGVFVTGPTVTGGGTLFNAVGRGADDIRVVSGAAKNGPSSRFLGDVVLDTFAAGIPAAVLVMSGSAADTKLVLPVDNAAGGGGGGTLRTLTKTSTSERHTLLTPAPVPPQIHAWSNRYDGPLASLNGSLVWDADIRRSGGSAAQITGWMEVNDGGGWVTLEETRGFLPVLDTTSSRIGGGAPAVLNPGDEFRIVFSTDTPATDIVIDRYAQIDQGQ